MPIEAEVAVAAADVGVHAAEPDFDQPFVLLAARAAQAGEVEHAARLVERHRVIDALGVGRQAQVVAGVDEAARQAELADDVPDADEADAQRRQLARDLVGERDRQRRAAAESDDVDGGVAGVAVERQAVHHDADAEEPAEAEGLGHHRPGVGLRPPADPLQIEAAPVVAGFLEVLVGILIGPEEVQRVAVEAALSRVGLVLVAGTVERIQSHLPPPPPDCDSRIS